MNLSVNPLKIPINICSGGIIVLDIAREEFVCIFTAFRIFCVKTLLQDKTLFSTIICVYSRKRCLLSSHLHVLLHFLFSRMNLSFYNNCNICAPKKVTKNRQGKIVPVITITTVMKIMFPSNNLNKGRFINDVRCF